VDQLLEMGVKGGRSGKKKLKIGICEDYRGDNNSVKFFAGLDSTTHRVDHSGFRSAGWLWFGLRLREKAWREAKFPRHHFLKYLPALVVDMNRLSYLG